MDVKKYIAGSMQEAVAKIKNELGSEAIIISTRKIRQGKGMFGLFGKMALEVTATAPKKESQLIDSFDTDNTVAAAKQQNPHYSSGPRENPGVPYIEEQTQGNQNAHLTDIILDPLRLEIDEVKSMLEDIREVMANEQNATDNIAHLRHEIYDLKGLLNIHLNNENVIPFKNLHKNLASIYQQLIINGVEEKFAKRLIEEARFKVPPQNFENAHYVKLYMARMIMQLIKVADIFSGEPGKEKTVYSFVGPTGVGKTATLAKMAGYVKQNTPDATIGIMSTDTARTGNMESLKEFSKSLRAKFRPIETEADLKKALREFKDRDFIFIDTPGSSQRETNVIQTLNDLLESVGSIKNILVLSATTKDADITEQTKRFGALKLAGVVFTKLDEATYHGTILNHLIRFKIPLHFVAAGQKIPDDIEVATKERIIDLIMSFSETEKT